MDSFDVCVRFYFSRIEANDEALHTLHFQASWMRDSDVEPFCRAMATNTAIHTLYLPNNHLTDAGVVRLCAMLEANTSVTSVDLRGNAGVTAEGSTAALTSLVTKNHTLRTLDVDIPMDRDLDELLGLNNMPRPLKLVLLSMRAGTRACERVDFSVQGPYNDPALSLFVRGVKEYPRCVKVIDFSGNIMGDERVKALAAILSVNTSLVELRLRDNRITHVGAASLATALVVNDSLTELDVTNNEIGDLGAQSFVATLKRNGCVLSYVHVGYNNVGPVALETLVTTLMYNAQPKAFKAIFEDLMCNNIRVTRVVLSVYGEDDVLRLNDASVRLLVKALLGNTSVTYLDLSNNKIADDGAAQLGHLLKNNNKLRTVVLDGNLIGPEGAVHVITGVKYNSSLDELTMDRMVPSLPQDTIDDLALLIAMNKHPIVMKKQGGLLMESDPSLTIFDLSLYDGTRRCTERTLKILGETLKKNTALRELYLGNNGGYVTLDSVVTFLGGIASGPGPGLVALHLNNNRLNDSVTTALITLMATSRTLKTLNLSQNDFTDPAPFEVSLATVNHTLTALDMSKNGKVSAASCQRLSLLCAYNTQRTTLKQTILRIERNDPHTTNINLVEHSAQPGTSSYAFAHTYGDVTIRLLCNALRTNTFVTVMDLSGNAVTDVGAGHIADMLVVNCALLDLKVEDNAITEVGIELIAEALVQNRSLRKLACERNPFKLAPNHPTRKKISVALASNASVKTSVFSVFDGSKALTVEQMKLIDDEILNDALIPLRKSVAR